MIKAPAELKEELCIELKDYVGHVKNLIARDAKEQDTRMVIDDILGEILGYNKFKELRTEFQKNNGKLDYIVKLTAGPNVKKADDYDFIIEAKAANIDLKQIHVDQTLTYCLSMNIGFFILTNARDWELYKVTRSKGKPKAELIWEVDFIGESDMQVLADKMYAFSRNAYLEKKWQKIRHRSEETDIGDVMAIIYSEKSIKSICETIDDLHDVEMSVETVKKILKEKVFKDMDMMDDKILRKLNKLEAKKEMSIVAEVVTENLATIEHHHDDGPPPLPESLMAEFKPKAA